MDLPGEEQRRWVESFGWGPITSSRRQGRWRPQWFLQVRDSEGGERALLLRSARDPEQVAGSHLLSHFSIEREARVLESLQDTSLRVPRYFGFHAPSQSILMEVVEGDADFSGLVDPRERESIADDYVDQLIELHGLDVRARVGDLDPMPTTPEQTATANKFRFAELDYEQGGADRRPDPLLEYGRWWLHRNLPAGERPACLLQGDTGPGQFLFARGNVTALIDWEMAHVGDPMLDLGVMRMREVLYPTGLVPRMLQRYGDRAHHGVDRGALHYYTVMSMLLSPLAMAASLERPSGLQPTIIQRFAWDVILRRGLCEALLEAVGGALTPPDLARLPGEVPMLPRLLGELLDGYADRARSEHERYEMRSASQLAEVVSRSSAIAPELEAADCRDIQAATGRTCEDREQGMRLLSEIVAAAPDRVGETLLGALYRIQRRREHLFEPILREQAHAPLEWMEPPGSGERA